MRFPLFLAACALSGCGSIVATTVATLDRISPLSADPASFAVKITLPEGVDVTPGSAEFIFSGRQSPAAETISGAFVLARETDVFRFAEEDLDDIRALQAQFAAWEAADPVASSGSIGVNMTPCRHGEGPSQDDRVSISVQVAEDGIFLPLVRDAALSTFTDAETIASLEPCP